MLHQLFLEPEGIYLVVFNGQELVVPPGTELVGTPQRFATNKTPATCLEYLSLWLNSIYAFAPGAPVFVVCTCNDLFDDAQRQKIHEMVVTRVLFKTPCRDQVIKCPYLDHDHNDRTGMYLYFVDNTSPADPSVGTLRDQIEQVINKHPYIEPHVSIQMPTEWLQVLDKINERVRQKHQQRITRRAFVEIAQECGVGKTRIPLQDEVNGLLEKFQKLGLLVWYDQPLLRDVVVLDPQWLINAATRIIRDRKLHPLAIDLMTGRNLRRQLASLYEHARLDAELLPHVFPETSSADEGGDSYSADERQQLMQLFEQFWLAVPVNATKKTQKTWLIPSLLTPRPGDLRESGVAGATSANTCYLHFFSQCGCHTTRSECDCPPCFLQASLEEDGFLPDGLFPRLLGKLTLQEPQPPSEMFQDFARFGSGKHAFSIEHLPKLNSIRLSIMAENPLPAHRQVVRAVDEALAALGIAGRLHHRLLFQHDGSFIWHGCLKEGAAADGFIISDMPVAELRKQPLIAPWFEQQGTPVGYDVFLSYKHGVDSVFAANLYENQKFTSVGPAQRRPVVYLDCQRSKPGQQLVAELLTALRKSKVIVVIISVASLSAMQTPSGSCDYLLLEYWAMLEFYGARNVCQDIDVRCICPLAAPSPRGPETSIFADLNKRCGTPSMPDEVHAPTQEALQAYFEEHLPGVEPKPRTIRSIVDDLLKFTGIDMTSKHSNAPHAAFSSSEEEWFSDRIKTILDGLVGSDASNQPRQIVLVDGGDTPVLSQLESPVRIASMPAPALPSNPTTPIPSQAELAQAQVDEGASVRFLAEPEAQVTNAYQAAADQVALSTDEEALRRHQTLDATTEGAGANEVDGPQAPMLVGAADQPAGVASHRLIQPPASWSQVAPNPVLAARRDNVWDVFFSHSQAEAGQQTAILADQLELTAYGLNPWFDQWNGKGSEATGVIDVTKAGMMQGVQQSAVFVLVLTKGVFTRPYCRLEIITAIKAGKPIITVMEPDPRFSAINFNTIKQGVPIGFHKIIDRIMAEVSAIPIRRDLEERKTMLSKIFDTYVRGLGKVVSFTQVEIAEAEAAVEAQSQDPTPMPGWLSRASVTAAAAALGTAVILAKALGGPKKKAPTAPTANAGDPALRSHL